MPVDAVGWLLVIFVLIIILFMAVTFLRKRLRAVDEAVDQPAFTLGDLRQLVKQGKLTQAEYDRLRDKMVAVAKKDAPDPLAGRRPKTGPPDDQPTPQG